MRKKNIPIYLGSGCIFFLTLFIIWCVAVVAGLFVRGCSPYPPVATRALEIAHAYRTRYLSYGSPMHDPLKQGEIMAQRERLRPVTGNLYETSIRGRKVFFAPINIIEREYEDYVYTIFVCSSPLEIIWDGQPLVFGETYSYEVYGELVRGPLLSPVPPVPGCLLIPENGPDVKTRNFHLQFTDEAIANLRVLYPDIAREVESRPERIFKCEYGMSEQVRPRALFD